MYPGGGGALRFNDAGPLTLRDYFGAGGGGNDLTVWVQTSGATVSFSAGDIHSAGGNYVNFNLPAEADAVVAGIDAGERFILALTRPAPIPTPTLTPTLTPTPTPTPQPTPTVPTAPQNLTAPSVSHDSVTLSWDDPGDNSITGYMILRRDIVNQAPGTFITIEDDTGSAATTYTDTTMAQSTRYAYRIKAHNATGTSAQSNYVSVTTPDQPPTPEPTPTPTPTLTPTPTPTPTLTPTPQPTQTPPSAPTGLTAPSVSHDSVTLRWDDPGDNSITGYQALRRSRDGDTYGDGQGAAEFVAVTDDTGSAATTYTDMSVTPRTRYVYRVKAMNGNGLGPRSTYLNVETTAQPPTPTPTETPTPTVTAIPTATSTATSTPSETFSQMMDELVEAVATSTAYLALERTLLDCVERRTGERHDSLEDLLSEYTGATKTAFDACDEAEDPDALEQIHRLFVSELERLKNGNSTYADLLDNDAGRQFSQSVAAPAHVKLSAALAAAQPDAQASGASTRGSSARGVSARSVSDESGDEVDPLSEEGCLRPQRANELDLPYRLSVLNCLVFDTPHSFWVNWAEEVENAGDPELFNRLDEYDWLHYGDEECSDLGFGPITVPIPDDFVVHWPFPACLKHDVGLSSLQRIIGGSSNVDDVDDAFNPRNKHLADIVFGVDLRCGGHARDTYVHADYISCRSTFSWSSALALLAHFYSAGVSYGGVLTSFHWPVTEEVVEHAVNNRRYVSCDIPRLRDVEIEQSTTDSRTFTVSWQFDPNCATEEIEKIAFRMKADRLIDHKSTYDHTPDGSESFLWRLQGLEGTALLKSIAIEWTQIHPENHSYFQGILFDRYPKQTNVAKWVPSSKPTPTPTSTHTPPPTPEPTPTPTPEPVLTPPEITDISLSGTTLTVEFDRPAGTQFYRFTLYEGTSRDNISTGWRYDNISTSSPVEFDSSQVRRGYYYYVKGKTCTDDGYLTCGSSGTASDVMYVPEPTPVTPEPTPVTPEPTPVTPEPTPVTPEPTPVTPEPTPVTPEPTPTPTPTATYTPTPTTTYTPIPTLTPTVTPTPTRRGSVAPNRLNIYVGETTGVYAYNGHPEGLRARFVISGPISVRGYCSGGARGSSPNYYTMPINFTAEGCEAGTGTVKLLASPDDYELDRTTIRVRNRPKPTATRTPTPYPTATYTPRPTATRTPWPTATNTPWPTPTYTPRPTRTPYPTATYTPRPTRTPKPTATNTPRPTWTPTPTPTPPYEDPYCELIPWDPDCW